ncbi:MAG TPA: M1 family metallopeptidase [Kofleriaceae bacterium]|nr:M1 family metallopeptidase [Kofleriaceae bacterium]
MRVKLFSPQRPLRGVVLVTGLASCGLLAVVAHGRTDQVPVTVPAATSAPPATGAAVQNEDGITVAGWDAGPVRVPSAPEAWGGERTGSEPTLSQRVADYELRAVVDPVKHTIEGTEKLRWRNRSDRAVRTLYFHTYLNGFEGPGSTWMTEKARYGKFRSGVELKPNEWGYIDVQSISQAGQPATMRYVQPDGGPATDRSVLRVDLPSPVAAGGETSLDIKFHDQLPRVIARTGWFDRYHLVAQWFPKIGVLELAGERGAEAPRWNVHEFHLNSEFYADWGSYDLEIVAPRGFTVGAVGARTGEPRETPEGVVHHFHQDDVHDVAFTMWDGFAPPLKGSYDGPGSPHVDVQVLYPPEWEGSARVALQATIDSLRYFSQTLGPYPYKTMTVVVPPFNADESGGMEYETFFTTIGGGKIIDSAVRYVTVHEFGHGYFMGLLASNEFEEPFLDEGMNEWWDSRMLEGEELAFDFGWFGRLGFRLPVIHVFDFQWLGGSGIAGNPLADPIAGNSWHRMSASTYGSVYPRTALVMHDLEHRLGGDVIARGMKRYYARWHHRHPSAADLRDALTDAAPEHRDTIRAWFDEQVYAADVVDDEIDQVEAEELVPRPGRSAVDGKTVERTPAEVESEISDKRAAYRRDHPESDGGAGPFPFRSVVRAQRHAAQVPQTLVVEFADGSQDKLAWPTGERWHRWVFERPVKVTQARLDPANSILLDVDKLDDGRTREAHRFPAMRLAVEATTWVDVFLALVSSL